MKSTRQKQGLLAVSVAMALGSGYAIAQHEQESAMPSSGQVSQDAEQPQNRTYSVNTQDSDHDRMQSERSELKQIADQAIARVKMSEDVGVDVEQTVGYAVFDAYKAGLIVTGAGGTGIAIDNDSGRETYMHVGGAGVGLGAGVENYQLVLLFERDEAFDEFIDGQWSGSASAQAVAGDEGASDEVQSLDGVIAYRVSDEGLIAQVDVSGMRFWPDDDLNREN